MTVPWRGSLDPIRIHPSDVDPSENLRAELAAMRLMDGRQLMAWYAVLICDDDVAAREHHLVKYVGERWPERAQNQVWQSVCRVDMSDFEQLRRFKTNQFPEIGTRFKRDGVGSDYVYPVER